MLLVRAVLNVGWRLGIVAACCLGIQSAWKIAQADLLFRHDEPGAIRAAIRVEPDAWPYYVRLSQLDEEHTRDLLRKALALDPFDAQANINLGLLDEADGDYRSAEKYFKDAFVVDRTYLPRWSLTNYYLRRGNLLEFWVWAERAAQMPPGDVGPLFQICWRVEPDPAKIEARIVGNDPALTLKFLEFLLDRNQVSSAAPLASRLLVIGAQKDDLSALFDVVNSLVRAGDAAAASALWHQMMSRNWVFADAAFPYNGDFARDPLPVLFDWSVAGLTGIHSWTGHGGLVSELTGSQPENCVIAQEVVPLLPGSYRMYYSYRTTGIPPGSGLRWQLLSAPTGALVAQSGDLSSDYLKPDMLKFLVPSYQSLYTLRLVYIRTPGTTRVSGTLVSGSVRLQVDSQQ